MLLEDQQRAFDEIIALIKAGHRRIRLIGSAGVGKTVLASELVSYICRDKTINPNFNNGKVYVTAPTNKALSILQNKINAPVDFKTIHSALKMYKVTNGKSGQKYFVKGKKANNDFSFAKACIIDECSMLNSDFVGGNENVPKAYLDDYPFPIIYIGDDKQLPPVGEANSPVFIQDYPEVRLTQIVRQGAGNPIIDLSRDLDMIYFKTPSIIDGKGYIYSDNREAMINDLAEVNGTDDLKYLAYTNMVVDSINQLVRQKRYGNPKKIEKDETIVFNSPYGSFYTNKEVKVEQLDTIASDITIPTEKTRFTDDGPMGRVDTIKMKYYRINDAINIVHESSEQVYKIVLSSINENCKKYGWDYRGRDLLIDQFADIKYNHAITIHKSQGSTYKEAIINIGNIGFNKDLVERQKMLYTAVTRASNLVILNNVK
jgi:exodeoxyribonuclease-5